MEKKSLKNRRKFNFKNTVFFLQVTGAGHGIGKELALQFASKGATVVCWDINKKGNEQTVKDIAEIGYPKAYSYEYVILKCAIIVIKFN